MSKFNSSNYLFNISVKIFNILLKQYNEAQLENINTINIKNIHTLLLFCHMLTYQFKNWLILEPIG